MTKTGGHSVVALLLALALAPAAGATHQATQSGALFTLVNTTRAHYGLGALRRTAALDHSATLKASEIVHCGSFSHTPCGASFTRSFQQVGYFRGRASVGENLYWGTSSLGSPSQAIGAWLRSPPHRANLLGSGWRDTGIAVFHLRSLFGQSDVWLYVLQFGRRS